MTFIKQFNRPALIVIGLMVLINAGIFFYFDDKSAKADQAIRNNVAQIEKLGKTNSRILREAVVEREIRADQTCELFESDHKKDVDQLRDTYRFILQASPADKQTGLYKFVVLNLPRTEQEARTDAAPEYCDAPDTGLPEPDPKIPERPKEIDHLTKQITPES